MIYIPNFFGEDMFLTYLQKIKFRIFKSRLAGRPIKVKLSLCLIKHYATNAYGRVDVQIHIFLTSELASHPGRFTPPRGKSPRYPLDRLGGPQGRSG
jgi:hypothetical protein